MSLEVEFFTGGILQKPTGSEPYKSVFNTYYQDNRSEFIILNTELYEAGLGTGSQISKMGFLVAEVSSRNLSNVKIGIKHTRKTNFSNRVFEPYSTFQEVFNSAISSSIIQVDNWFDFYFTSIFTWNGIDNITITVLRDDNGYKAGGNWMVSQSRSFYYDRFIGMYEDSKRLSPFDEAVPSGSVSQVMPCMRFTVDRIQTTKINSVENFTDEDFLFPINTSWNNYDNYYKFQWKTDVALDGSSGYLHSTNAGKGNSSSAVFFDFIAPPTATRTVLNINIAIQSEAKYDIAIFSMIEEDVLKQIDNSTATASATHFQTFSILLKNGVNTIGLLYKKDSSGDTGLDMVQILSMSLDSYYEEVKTSHPIIAKLVVDKPKISDEIDMNQSIITIQFSKDVVEYVARLNGVDHATGVIVHQGGAVSANTNAQVVIDWDELSSEGVNRINVYGKDVNGLWTPYEN